MSDHSRTGLRSGCATRRVTDVYWPNVVLLSHSSRCRLGLCDHGAHALRIERLAALVSDGWVLGAVPPVSIAAAL